MTYDTETAIGPKPFVFTGIMRHRVRNRELMRRKRADPTYRDQERERRRIADREKRVCLAFALCRPYGRFEDQPGAD